VLNPAKIKIALEFLDAAIVERELHGRHFASMNLAGIAEELLGKMVRISGDKDQRTEAVDVLLRLQDSAWPLLGWKKMNRKEMIKFLSKPKNSIKHMDNISDSHATLIVPPEQDSEMQIKGAIKNLKKMKIEPSMIVKDFIVRYPNVSS
jgi:hypothetical protein